jgi:hypothetical protein
MAPTDGNGYRVREVGGRGRADGGVDMLLTRGGETTVVQPSTGGVSGSACSRCASFRGPARHAGGAVHLRRKGPVHRRCTAVRGVGRYDACRWRGTAPHHWRRPPRRRARVAHPDAGQRPQMPGVWWGHGATHGSPGSEGRCGVLRLRAFRCAEARRRSRKRRRGCPDAVTTPRPVAS